MPNLLEAFCAELTATRATRTVATYRSIASAFLASHPSAGAESPSTAEIEQFLARARPKGRPASAATRNQELAALRVLGAFAVRRGYWARDPCRAVPFLREPPRDPAVLSRTELQRFFRAAGEERGPAIRARNLCVLALLSQAGLRVHELVALDAAQVDAASATLLSVRGKGGTVHDVPLNRPALALTLEWLERRGDTITPDFTQPALLVTHAGTRMTIRSVQRLIAALRRSVGTPKRITPHSLRHTTATLAILAGADLGAVADLLRHDDLNTTRVYLRLVDERRRNAVRLIAPSVPEEILRSEGETPAGPARAGSPEIPKCARRPPKRDLTHEDDLDAHDGLGDKKRAA